MRVKSPDPDPFEHLEGPRRTRWKTLVWSDPDAPPLELFGPPPGDDIPGPIRTEPTEGP